MQTRTLLAAAAAVADAFAFAGLAHAADEAKLTSPERQRWVSPSLALRAGPEAPSYPNFTVTVFVSV